MSVSIKKTLYCQPIKNHTSRTSMIIIIKVNTLIVSSLEKTLHTHLNKTHKIQVYEQNWNEQNSWEWNVEAEKVESFFSWSNPTSRGFDFGVKRGKG